MQRALLLLLASVVLLPTPALSQDCSLGIYADAEGTENLIFNLITGEPFDLYAVMYVEDAADAVAYRLVVPDLFDPVLNPDGIFFLTSSVYGPNGTGINVSTPGGDNVGLGVCDNGFGGQPILVANYQLFLAGGFYTGGEEARVAANTDIGFVQYSDCQGGLHACDIGPGTLLGFPVATESVSWGAVKNLFQTP